MKVSFYLKKAGADYETLIYVTISYAGNRIRIFTDERIHPQFWNSDRQRVRQTLRFPTNPEFNSRLDSIETKIRNVYRSWKVNNGEKEEPSVPILTNLIKKELGRTPEVDKALVQLKTFWGFFEDFIDRSAKGIRTNKNKQIRQTSIGSYRNLFNSLKKYERAINKKLDFDSFDMHLYNQYYSYLIGLNLATNTIGKQFSILKVVLREAYEDGYSRNTIFNHSKFRSVSEPPQTIYLNNDELAELAGLEIINKRLDRVRDTFIIGCLTGLRFSDISKLKLDDIEDGIIEIVQTKTGNPVAIPLRQKVLDIIAKYDNNFPKVMSNQKFNQYLKELCALCPSLQKEISVKEKRGGVESVITKPKYEFVSSHTARRSFATNEFLAKDIKTYQIMAITGHKTEKSFYRYIRLTPEENAKDIANIWQKRDDKQAVVLKHHLKIVKSINE
ncbi:MAG: hypothetical protein DI598_00645 [Pseudopedobacter saltans]|uniref:Tyr recombinase domain-containing protein n=1 Tax=Pseudopedobacter saltans TaxID=151895 RepID=A0A2W5FDQ2_9SPHI|nr:MAG: hypothetical protein DI598_00645 [Pseudopedobacter saltans]